TTGTRGVSDTDAPSAKECALMLPPLGAGMGAETAARRMKPSASRPNASAGLLPTEAETPVKPACRHMIHLRGRYATGIYSERHQIYHCPGSEDCDFTASGFW